MLENASKGNKNISEIPHIYIMHIFFMADLLYNIVIINLPHLTMLHIFFILIFFFQISRLYYYIYHFTIFTI